MRRLRAASQHVTQLYFSSVRPICRLFHEKHNTFKTNKTYRLNAAKQKRNMNLKHVIYVYVPRRRNIRETGMFDISQNIDER